MAPRLDHPGFLSADVLRDAFRRVLTKAGIGANEPVALAVPNAIARFRVFSSDELGEAKGPDMIRFRLQKLMPFDAADARIAVSTPESGGARGALGVGASAAVVGAYEAALRAFDIDCGSVEPSLIPLLRAAAVENDSTGDALVIDLDAACLAIAILRDGWPAVIRTFGPDVAASAGEIEREIGATAVFWKDRLAGVALTRAALHAPDAAAPALAGIVRRAFGIEPRRASGPRAFETAGLPAAQAHAAAAALSLLSA
jgi:hypothetical protein